MVKKLQHRAPSIFLTVETKAELFLNVVHPVTSTNKQYHTKIFQDDSGDTIV